MITFENINGGIGNRAMYGVYRDGEKVATMRCGNNRGLWTIHSIHYFEHLGEVRGIDAAKARARELTYPQATEVYEKLCAVTEIRRRSYIEQQNAHKLALYAKQLFVGSNSARQELEELVAEIDRFTVDRSDTHSAAQERADEANRKAEEADRNFRYSGKWHYTLSARNYPYYPNRPNTEMKS